VLYNLLIELIRRGNMNLTFEKYSALGNDYIVFDPQKQNFNFREKQIELICNRNLGIGSDGILYGPIYKDGKISVRIFNTDGSEAEKSGNGIRIFSKYLKDFGYIKENKFILNTLGGDVEVEYLNDNGTEIKVMMGTPSFNSKVIPVAGEEREVLNESFKINEQEYLINCVTVGNPHCVIFMKNPTKEKAIELGQYIEPHRMFPKRINCEFAEIVDRKNINVQFYERGVGYTLASGTSSSAVASVAYKLGLIDNDITIHCPGGDIKIQIDENLKIYMTGSVDRIGTAELCEEFMRVVEKL
jgi:diaminopimelate epimerase